MNVIIGDDRLGSARVLVRCLTTLWPDYHVVTVKGDALVLRACAEQRADMAIVNVARSSDGLAVCRQLRQADPALIIVALNERTSALDELRAYDAGVDEYLVQPLEPIKVRARLRALIRRVGAAARIAAADRDRVVIGDMALDLAARQVRVAGTPVDLTPTEYILMETLAREQGRFVPHRELLERAWGAAYANQHHYLKVFVNRLRRKLGDDAAFPRYIETRRGQGYRLGTMR
jgi:DNA-binding response OmpR family regulator